jgi:hypothetical protein
LHALANSSHQSLATTGFLAWKALTHALQGWEWLDALTGQAFKLITRKDSDPQSWAQQGRTAVSYDFLWAAIGLTR